MFTKLGGKYDLCTINLNYIKVTNVFKYLNVLMFKTFNLCNYPLFIKIIAEIFQQLLLIK